MSDEFDRQGLSAMVDYWISPAAVKREFEATKSKYFRFSRISTALLQNFPCCFFFFFFFFFFVLGI